MASQEAHSGSYGYHFCGKSLVNKLLCMGYYWKNMEKYYFSFFKRCPQCQNQNNLIHACAHEIHFQVASWIFNLWFMDLI